MITLDTETCGFHGMPVLIQYAKDNGPIQLFDIWKNPIKDSLELIKEFTCETITGFNLAFDWFHICKLQTVFSLFPDKNAIPENFINEIALLEPKGRYGPCVKPRSACDLMLVSRKGPYQSLMQRDEIRIRRVPTALAWRVAGELENRVVLDDIFFARKKNKLAPKWSVYDIEDDEDFKDIVINFAPSGALKSLALHALNEDVEKILKFTDVNLPETFNPEELGYAPFALAVGSPSNWKGAWPEKIKYHIEHWATNEKARTYGTSDVDYTCRLFDLWKPEPDDDDSVLACMVAAVRWRGYKVNIPKLQLLKAKAEEKANSAPKAPDDVRRYIGQHLSEVEKVVIQGSTKKQVLEEISKWKDHPAGAAAQNVLAARFATKEIELYNKILLAGRLHASFKVIGTKSDRMSGDNKLNPQAIDHDKIVRECFELTDDPEEMPLCGGDFDSFEVVLADCTYNDPDLRQDLMSGKKIHALFAEQLFPDMTYDEIMASKGTADDKYDTGKKGVFSIFYGGNEQTLKNRLGIAIEAANEAYTRLVTKYKQIGIERQKIFNMFCSMRQPNGIGTKVEWHEPSDYIESIFGFRRYFTLENRVCKQLFLLAQNPPKEWRAVNVKVKRREREQTGFGASQSALYAAAFNIQAGNMRAAANHVIQASGAQITKRVQRRVWDTQPYGIHPFIVVPMNVHDEILCPTHKDYAQQVKQTVHETVESYRPTVPLIKMDWCIGAKNWADLKG